MAAIVEERLDLQTAADELGVHYQTAYRWVRRGSLRAEMVGGRYLVSRADVIARDRLRSAPRLPPAPKVARLDHAAERMHEALVGGDEKVATQIARRLADEGAPIVDIIQKVLVPPMRRIGEQWHGAEVTVWVEHRASAIVERILGELAPNPRGRRRGIAVVASLTGERHALPTTMAAIALRADNWHVHHLGADLPPEQLLAFCAGADINLAVITVTHEDAREVAENTAAELRAAGTPTIVGGTGHELHELIGRARSARS